MRPKRLRDRQPATSARRDLFMISLAAFLVFVFGMLTDVWQAFYVVADRHLMSRFGDLLALITIVALAFALIAIRRATQLRRETARREEAERRFKALVEEVPAITYTWDASKQAGEVAVPFVSPQVESILGYTQEEWMSDPMTWVNAIYPEDRDRIVQLSNESDRTGRPFTAEYRIVAKDGRIVWIHDESVAVKWDASGRPVLAQGVMFDISRRKEAEERLQEAENRYRTIVERVPTVSYVWDAGYEPGTIPPAYISPQIKQLLGFTDDEWLEDPTLWAQRAHPDDHDRVLRTWEACVRSDSSFTAEYRMFAKDGSLVWVRDEAVPVSQGSRGHPIYQGVMVDISELKRADEQVRQAEERYRTLVENLPVVSYVSDIHGEQGVMERYVSPGIESLTGYTSHEWLADPDLWRKVMHPLDRGPTLEEARRSDDAGHPFDAEYRIVKKDGRIVWVHDQAVVVERDDGRHAEGILLDVTERRGAEERYRRLVEQLPLVVYITSGPDTPGQRYIAPGIERLLGYTQEEWLSDIGLWSRCLHPDDRERVIAESRRTEETQEPFQVEYRLLHRDGAVVWVRDEAAIVHRSEDGGASVWQGFYQDITGRRQAEQMLQETERRFRTLVEALPAITYVEDPSTGENLYISPQIEAVLGYTPEEWMADPSLWETLLHPEDKDRVVAENDADSGDSWSVDYRTRTRDGRTIWVHNDAVLIRDEDGGPLFWQGVAFDVTERKEAEERLREAEFRYRSLVEQMPAVVYIDAVDELSTALYVSPQYERLMGYTAVERMTDPDMWVRQLHPEDRDRAIAESLRTNETGDPFDIEYRMIRKDGSVVWVRDHAVLVRGADGETRFWQGVLTDISESKLADEALARRDRILETAGFAAERFLNAPAWSDAIDDVLERLGKTIEASRSYVFETDRDPDRELVFMQKFEWVDSPDLALIDDELLQRFRVKDHGFGRWEKILGAGEAIHGPVRKLPKRERPMLEWQSILSICVVPVFVAGEPWGLIGFDQCDTERVWLPAEIEALKVVATTLGAAIGRERAERRLSETETRYQTLVEQIPAITYVEDPLTGRVLYMSPQLKTMLGYLPDEWEPETYWRLIHPDDLERVRAEDDRTNETGDPYMMEFRQQAKDGHWVWLRDEAILIRDERGNPLCWQGVRFDVTAQKEAEQQLRDAEERYRVLVEQMPAVTYIVGPPGNKDTVYVSPQVEDLFGYTAEEWIGGRLWLERLHPDDHDRVVAADVESDDSGEPFSEDYRIIHRDGRVVWVRDESVLARDEQGNPLFWQGVRFDITAQKEAENRLRRTEERFRTLVEQLPAVTYIDEFREGAVATWPTIYISPQIESLLGYSPDEWKADPDIWLRLVHPEDRDRAMEADGRHYEGGEPLAEEIRMFARDGTARWVRDEAVIIRDEDGRPRWSQGILVDITARKEAEQQLHEAEERYRTLVERLPAIIYLAVTGEGAPWLYVSPQVESMLGYTAEEWKENPRLWMDVIHPDDLERVLSEELLSRDTGQALVSEYRMRARDGRIVWVRDEAEVVEALDGGQPLLQGLMLDITERKAAEDQLLEAERRYRAIVEHVPAAIYVDVPDGSMQTIYVSPQIEQIMGVTPERYVDDPEIWLTLMHPDDRDEMLRTYTEAIEQRTSWRGEYRILREDGREVWVHDETTFLQDESGTPLFLQGVMFDATEQKLAEQALRDSERREREAAERLRALDEMKNTFLAAVSHELRSPLTSILGLSLTLERQDALGEEDRADLLERLSSNARKLDRLLRDLLDIDRLSRGIVAPQYRVTDVGALARRTVESLESLADRSVVVRTEPVVISVDPAKVERIVENLLVNAARHTSAEHEIWLLVGPQEGGVLIAVEDDGPGVPEELREPIFEPFRQGPTASKASPGTGIGLSLVARFAELHGGRAWVEDRDGGGASFRVFLPGGPSDGQLSTTGNGHGTAEPAGEMADAG